MDLNLDNRVFPINLDARPSQSTRRAGLLDQLSQLWWLLTRAQSAAHAHEALSRKCDAALAEQGLRCSDVPRIAYYELTKKL